MHVDLHFAPLGLALLLSTGACALRIFYALRPFAAAEKKLPERGAYLAIRGNWFLAAQAISFSAAGGVRLKPPVISGVKRHRGRQYLLFNRLPLINKSFFHLFLFLPLLWLYGSETSRYGAWY